MAARLPSLAQIHPRLPDFMQLMRLDRPIGTLLLLWPTLWALWFAAEGFPHPGILVVFVLGVFIMRAAGCVINDYADRHVDGHVKRTRERPLATGRISEKEALTLFFGLCLAAFLLVLFFTNTLTLQLSFIGVALAFVYPFMKRYTHLPQLFLGAAFSMAIPMAWAAQTGEIAQLAWVLFLANLVWTVAYDTLYAMVDRDDDVKIGIKSTAVLLGDLDRPVIAFLQVMVVITLLLAGHQAGLSWLYNLGVLIMAGLFIHQQRLTRHRTRPECFQAFLNNNWAGCAVFLGVFLDYLLLS